MTRTALLVEDEFLLLEATRDDLEELGLQTLCAHNCDAGWETLKSREDIDILITDIRTPGRLDGWQLARDARGLRPELPVIYVSGYSAEQPQRLERSILLPKPYRFTDLTTALQSLGVL